jgi:hypothetical protein
MRKTLRRQARKNNPPQTRASFVPSNEVFDLPGDMKADSSTGPTAVRPKG